MSRNRRLAALATIALLALTAAQVGAFGEKEPQSDLDLLAFVSPELRVGEVSTDADQIRGSLPNIEAMDQFRAEYGDEWRFTIDEKRGVATLVSGGAIPFIPGHANDLSWQDETPGCTDNTCIPVGHVEILARDFVDAHSEILGVRSADLILDPEGSRPFGRSIYLLRFGYQVDGVTVDRASVRFRVNGGNLIQVATENVAPTSVEATPTLDRASGWTVVEDYLGPFSSADDRISDRGSLHFIPVTPAGMDPDEFAGPIGSGMTYRLAWRYAFDRPDVIGSWEAVVDAHTGELLRFVDTNQYGRVHGGAYPGDNATTTLQGKYAVIDDDCGNISNTTTTGDVDFSLGPGTDCDVPPGNTGGPGNTHSARTQYYHLTAANLRAQGYRPDLTWLTTSFITVYTNQSPWCNATSGGAYLNFYKADSGCWNLGEIPGVAIHEWGHSLDNFDGSGGGSRPVETYADWMAALHLHDSCVGRGFKTSGYCGGYGDPCTECSGIRDMDYTKHQGNTPWTAANYGSLWNNSGSSYYGPCGIGAHAEAGIGTQALWDMVIRKFTAPPHSMDLRTAWLLADHLWYGSISTLGYDMYTCSPPSSDGCAGASLYNVYLAVDDDGDGVGNGTPHADAIFSALDDHNIACYDAGHAQNQAYSTCPTLTATTLTGVGANNSAELSWDAVPNATRYYVYRNDIGCDAGLTRIAEVAAPATSYTDTTVVNGIIYYYMIQAAAESDSCTSLVSNCSEVVPVPCETPTAPTGLTATANGDNRIDLSWSGGGPAADTFNVYRAVGSCPQSDYELVAGGIADLSWSDDPVSGQVTYSYVVTASDVTLGCESAESNCDDTSTTGACTQGPTFDGLTTVTNPGNSYCTLDLDWDPAVIHCDGPAVYNVFRSTDPDFTPGLANRIASDIDDTAYTDTGDLFSGTDYTYVVRARDVGNGSGEDNTERVGGAPTGPIVIGTWADDAGDDGNAKLDLEDPWEATAGQGVTGAGYYTGPYTDDLCAAATTPLLSLDANPQLSFWSKYGIETGWDKGLVQISTDGGSTWERVPVNYPGTVNQTNDECDLGTGGFFNGTSTTWTEYSASLATWANQEVMLRWIFSSDGYITGNGWWVDDISITDVAVFGTCDTEPPLFADDFESGGTTSWSRITP
jgi:hypothetical protein